MLIEALLLSFEHLNQVAPRLRHDDAMDSPPAVPVVSQLLHESCTFSQNCFAFSSSVHHANS